jgi:acyl dehydratase
MEDPKSYIGKETPEFTFEIDKGNIRDFAIAIGDLDPMFYDEEYATKTRFKGIIASNTFSHALRGEKSALLRAIPQIGSRIPQNLLHGEHEIEYFKPIHPGDLIRFKIKIADITEREGKRFGKMDAVVLEVPCFNQKGEMVVKYSQTFVVRR